MEGIFQKRRVSEVLMNFVYISIMDPILSIYFLTFKIMCAYAHMCAHECSCCGRPQENIRFLEVGVAKSCEPLQCMLGTDFPSSLRLASALNY